MRRALLLAGFLTLSALDAGCDGDGTTGEVTGAVMIDGAPAPDGAYVTLRPADNAHPAQAAEVKGGKYAVRVAVGKSLVVVNAPRKIGEKKLYATPDSPTRPILEESLPDRYNEKSELSVDVRPGTQVYDLRDLKSKPKK